MRDVTDASAFIEEITYAIWNEPGRDPGLCSVYYGPTTVIHTDAGDVEGGAAVTANTRERLSAFPDFRGVIDDTIWTGDDECGYRTSMRWTWTGTHLGTHAFGAATGRSVGSAAIADCVVRDGVIVEEWLVTDPLALACQLGAVRPGELAAAAQVRPTPVGSPMTPGPGVAGGAARHVAEVLAAGVGGEDVTAAYAPNARVQVGAEEVASPARRPAGCGGPAWLRGWSRLLGRAEIRVDDGYARPGPDGTTRVATRWTVLGPGGPVVTAASHHHLRDGLIVAEWTLYDRLAVLARAGGLP